VNTFEKPQNNNTAHRKVDTADLPIQLSSGKPEYKRPHSHFAMNAFFDIFIDYPDSDYAKRYVVEIETFQCLLKSRDTYRQTFGAFNPAAGKLIAKWKEAYNKGLDTVSIPLTAPGLENIILHTEDYSVETLSDALELDMGGIGKGFAADCIAKMLKDDWEIDRFLISAGQSTILAGSPPAGKPSWILTLSNPVRPSEVLHLIQLKNAALSASGISKGSHIIDSRTGKPVTQRLASWVACPNAADADALSTAFMINTPNEIHQFCKDNLKYAAMIALPAEKKDSLSILKFGDWMPYIIEQ